MGPTFLMRQGRGRHVGALRYEVGQGSGLSLRQEAFRQGANGALQHEWGKAAGFALRQNAFRQEAHAALKREQGTLLVIQIARLGQPHGAMQHEHGTALTFCKNVSKKMTYLHFWKKS